MAEQKFKFKLKIQGKEAGVVSAITPPVDVKETFGTRPVCQSVERSMDFHFGRP
jgi:hypothetical protein